MNGTARKKPPDVFDGAEAAFIITLVYSRQFLDKLLCEDHLKTMMKNGTVTLCGRKHDLRPWLKQYLVHIKGRTWKSYYAPSVEALRSAEGIASERWIVVVNRHY